jgi:CheY-like chemotaxis protein
MGNYQARAGMRILIVDDEQGFARLLAHALRKLGHEPVLALHPSDALELLRTEPFDAVITDIDMPEMNGVELAREIQARYRGLPVAFCTGSTPISGLVGEAAQIGEVLPKVWTVTDVRRVVDGLAAPVRFPRASSPSLAPPVEREPTAGHRSRRIKKIKVACRTWEQVQRLCEQPVEGCRVLTLRGAHQLQSGQRVTVALRLPDELVLSIGAVVASAESAQADVDGAYQLELTGLTRELCARLRLLSRSRGGAAGLDALPRLGTQDIEADTSETIDVGSISNVCVPLLAGDAPR